MKKCLLSCLFIFISIVVVKALTAASTKDSRVIYFYIWDKPTRILERAKKTLHNKSDSLRVIRVDLICQNNAQLIDTIPCLYIDDKIYFDAIDTTQYKLIDMSLSFEVNMAEGGSGFNEKLTVPFLFFFRNSNKNSSLSFAFERKKKTYFEVNMSKTDYPFIASSARIKSTVLKDHKD
jgi:hypothetical protein